MVIFAANLFFKILYYMSMTNKIVENNSGKRSRNIEIGNWKLEIGPSCFCTVLSNFKFQAVNGY